MQYVYGDVTTIRLHIPSAIVVSTCRTVNKKGELVMGAGAALAMKKKHPHVPEHFGYLLRQHNKIYGTQRPYGFFWLEYTPSTYYLGVFQTKNHWSEPSKTDIIQFSVERLCGFILDNPTIEIHMNIPGIGLGGLPLEDVHAIIRSLPDNVFVYTYHLKTYRQLMKLPI